MRPLADDMLDVGETVAGGVLDAPRFARGRPFDFRPQLAADGEVVRLGVDAANFDHAVASAICHFSFSFRPLPRFEVSQCYKPNNAGFPHF
jgi:hypothetical protein